MQINGVTACWSSLTYEAAVDNLIDKTVEPMFGVLSSEHIQLCPQHSNYLTIPLIEKLKSQYPQTQFRLHSDVRLKNKIGITIDLVDFNKESLWYFKTLSEYSALLEAPLYSLHAGARKNCTMLELFNKQKQLQDIFSCEVAIEGHYPFKTHHWLIDSWSEYEQLHRSELPFALDLSHLNIVAKREGWQWDLTADMVRSKHCKEVHISFNEGLLDNHKVAVETFSPLWNTWVPLLENANKNAVIFSEGNQVLALMHAAKNS